MVQVGKALSWITSQLNFFRIHVLFFIIFPLIAGAVFYASQDNNHPIDFIDALFICVSSITDTGLSTLNLSPLTQWQQAMLFVLMIIGDPIAVSWLMVYVRKSYFRRQFGDVVLQRMRMRAAKEGVEIPPELEEEVEAQAEGHLRYRVANLFRRKNRSMPHKSSDESGSGGSVTMTPANTQFGQQGTASPKLNSRIIRRTDDAPKLVDPSGWISEGNDNQPAPHAADVQPAFGRPGSSPAVDNASNAGHGVPSSYNGRESDHRGSIEGNHAFYFPRTATSTASHDQPYRSPQSVEFAHQPRPIRHTHSRTGSSLLHWDNHSPPAGPIRRVNSGPEGQQTYTSFGGMGPRTDTNLTTPRPLTRAPAIRPETAKTKDSGFGGFPGPFMVAEKAIHRFFPALGKKIDESINIPRTETLLSMSGPSRGVSDEYGVPITRTKTVPYLSFDTRVGRNSEFHDLTQERLEELGGVEYRALSMLLWILPAYYFGNMLFLFSILAPYCSRQEWHHVFAEQPKFVRPSWFAAFQSVSAFTNTGTSLVDQSMVPFYNAYAMEIPMFFAIIAGNTAFPIFLRFVIWIMTKVVPARSQANETLHFLLDHPRRCYIYMFPSHQTWFLLTVLVAMVMTDWISFLVLDIGTPAVEAIPLGTRFAVGLLQAGAVRAAGFAAVSLSALAPAVKVLYITMMYVSVYPIALSVRTTNVYEERSIGVFQPRDEDEDKDLEPEELQDSRAKVWGKYIAMHARQQLAFDIWWLGFALWVVCIVERGPLNDPDTQGWFNIFTLLFELVSAYGTIGLSLGLPDQNYSFSGALTPLSKFIVCLVMLRGRHRGLPVAIDRAVLLKGSDFPDSMAPDKQHHQSEKQGQGPQEEARPHTEATQPNEKRADQPAVHHTSHHHQLSLKHPGLALHMRSPSNRSMEMADHLMSTPVREMPPMAQTRSSPLVVDYARHRGFTDPTPGASESSKEAGTADQHVAGP
ncbi:low affinity potassium transporter [Tulasnella sp. JGI-2019a]|nr:low affinity potassium transporter [Tulasnella sp. JGI-2019a]